jgi:hypothetical protein
MPLQATSGAASYDAFGGGVPVVPNYIEDVFQTWLYTGTGAAQTITNGIDLSGKGGLVWMKGRSGATDHALYDTVRGATFDLVSNSPSAQTTQATGLTSFGSTGFSIGALAKLNTSAATYVSWTFREQPKFFDVVTYTGDGVAGRTIPHNLGSVPGFYVVKRTNGTTNWPTYHRSLGASARVDLDQTDASAATTVWNNTAPTSTVFSVSDVSAVNASGGTYVAYLFAHNAGGFGLTGTDNVISCGSFNTDGAGSATVNLGYEPQWLLYRQANAVDNWEIIDNMRGWTVDGTTAVLRPNLSNAEQNVTFNANLTATGFTGTGIFYPSKTYIYIAIRRGPMKVPTVGTTVFSPYTATLSSGTVVNAGLTPDLLIGKYRSGTDNPRWVDRLRGFANATGGTNPELYSNETSAEASSTAWSYNWNNTGYVIGNALNGLNSVIYSLRRAPSFFDEVCYTGTGVTAAYNHNLRVAPELLILKKRNATWDWRVYVASLGNNNVLYLNDPIGVSGSGGWNDTTPTSTQFTVASGYNTTSDTYVAYLFATCAGVSKVGSYTGTGATQTIACGFTGGARFVMIKRTDSTGDWFYWDTARGMVSGNDRYLLMNSNVGETNTNSVYTTTGGFEIVSTAAGINASGGNYIFLAIA